MKEECLSCDDGYYYDTNTKSCKNNPEPNVV